MKSVVEFMQILCAAVFFAYQMTEQVSQKCFSCIPWSDYEERFFTTPCFDIADGNAKDFIQ